MCCVSTSQSIKPLFQSFASVWFFFPCPSFPLLSVAAGGGQLVPAAKPWVQMTTLAYEALSAPGDLTPFPSTSATLLGLPLCKLQRFFESLGYAQAVQALLQGNPHVPMAQGGSGTWGRDLRSVVGLSKKNGPCENSFFGARVPARGKLLLWSNGCLYQLGESSPVGFRAELGGSCPAHVSCGCRTRAMAHPQVLAVHQGAQCVDKQPCFCSSGDSCMLVLWFPLTQGNAGPA